MGAFFLYKFRGSRYDKDREKVIQRQAGRGSIGDQTALSGM